MQADEIQGQRRAKVLWVIKGGGRWGLDLAEIAWSVRLDDAGRELFPTAQALALVREACIALQEAGELENRDNFYRCMQWSREPW